MNDNTDPQTADLLRQLTSDHREGFKKKINSIWLTLDPFGNQLNSRTISESKDFVMQSALRMASDAASQIIQISKSPDSFAALQRTMIEYITVIRSDLVHISSLASKSETSKIFDDAAMLSTESKIKDQVDSYESMFVVPPIEVIIPTTSTIDQPQKEKKQTKRGPRDRYEWFDATHHVWGEIYLGKLVPKSQDDIEDAFKQFFSKKLKKVGDSTVTPFASPIWEVTKQMSEDDN